MSFQLFSSGTARGGTNLVVQILSVNEQVSLAADPYLPIFREFRNSIMRASPQSALTKSLDPSAPIDDYYFSQLKLDAMREIQSANLELYHDKKYHEALIAALTQRTALSSGDLVPYLNELYGDNFTDLFTNAVEIIKKARKSEDCKWIGFNENWAIDFFEALAAGFPDSKFIVVLRDPRASISSALLETDLSKVPHVMSFARCWRKYVAFAHYLSSNPLFSGRLFILSYENLVREPTRTVVELSDFLDVTFDPRMLDTNEFQSPGGGQWLGNSHVGAPSTGIYTSSVDAWKSYLREEIVETIELVCGLELELLGYELMHPTVRTSLSHKALDFIYEDNRDCQGWRTGNGNLEQEIGSEMFRRDLVSEDRQCLDVDLINRCFLFSQMYKALKEKKSSIAQVNS